ncbi:hypothetical protein FBU31_002540 [Coemansia sp. 'formosensis']|nr:hypothetical protein FBU31_002540 [Coemansia sp. 'formosensis']
MVKISSLLTAALFGAVAMAMPVAKPDVVVVTVYKTALAVPTPVVNNVVVKTVYETVYAQAANVPSLIPHKPQPSAVPVVSVVQPAPIVSAVQPAAPAPVVSAVQPAAPAPVVSAVQPAAPAPVVTLVAVPTKTVAPATPSAAPSQAPSSGSWQTDMLNQVNAVRAKAGKAALTLSSQLNTIAQSHSQYMSSTSDMTHSDPAGSLGTRAAGAGLQWMGAAENIAWNQQNVAQVMDAWINSPGHYANMVGDYNSVGFGVSNLYWTQDFIKN